MITLDSLIDALALPADCRVDQRVSKRLIIDQGLPTPADKKRVQEGIEDVRWVAALKPNRIGVLPREDDVRSYREIVVMTAELRPKAKAPRVVELLHRLVPHPVLLAVEQAGTVTVSAAHKRFSLGEGGKMVLDDEPVLAHLEHEAPPGSPDAAFLASLALAGLPSADLFDLYRGWLDRVEALKASRITGRFTLPGARADSFPRGEVIAAHELLTARLATLRRQARAEKQINRRVELNLEIKKLEAELATIARQLG